MPPDLDTERVNRDAVHGSGEDKMRGRAHALEEAFFAKREREVAEAFRNRQAEQREVRELLAHCGIREAATATALVESGIRAETLPALVLTPLVAVAWADGELNDFEREALVEQALEQRIAPSSGAWSLLQSWMTQRPPDRLFDAWVAYTRELALAMPEDARGEFAREVLEMAEAIAQTSREHRRFDLGRAVDELRVLDRIERVFQGLDAG